MDNNINSLTTNIPPLIRQETLLQLKCPLDRVTNIYIQTKNLSSKQQKEFSIPSECFPKYESPRKAKVELFLKDKLIDGKN